MMQIMTEIFCKIGLYQERKDSLAYYRDDEFFEVFRFTKENFGTGETGETGMWTGLYP